MASVAALAALAGATIAAWRIGSAADRARTELSVCMAGASSPPRGTRHERVERAAYVAGVRRDPRFGELGIADRPVSPEARASRWPFECADAAGRVADAFTIERFHPRIHNAARELEEALHAGFLPRHLDGALFEPTGEGAADPAADEARAPERFDPALDEDALSASRVALAGVGNLSVDVRAAPRPGEIDLAAGALGRCRVEASDTRPLDVLRCGHAEVDSTPAKEALVDLLNGPEPGWTRRCAHPGGAVELSGADAHATTMTLAFETADRETARLPIARTPPAGGARPARDGDIGLSCAAGVARVTWLYSTVADGRDVHELHRAVCTPEACELSEVRVPDLGTRLLHRGSTGADEPDGTASPELVDVGERAWLLWERPRSIAMRVAPFAELASAPTRTLAATRGASDDLPFLSALATQGTPDILAIADGAALVGLTESARRLDGSWTNAAFLVRLDQSGAVSLLLPVAAPASRDGAP